MAKKPRQVKRAKIVREVSVKGEAEPRQVFYTRRERVFSEKGLPCLNITETCVALSGSLYPALNGEGTPIRGMGYLWDILNYVYGGNVPDDLVAQLRERYGEATPLEV